MRLDRSSARWGRTMLAEAVAFTALVLTLCAASSAGAQATSARSPEGTWQGSFMGSLRIVFHIQRDAGGRLVASADSPDQGATGLTVDSVAFEADTLRLELRRLTAAFVGRMEPGGDSLAGVWQQGGLQVPLGLKRSDRRQAPNRPQEPKKPYAYVEDTVRVENRAGGVSLGGTLTTPRGDGPFPCAVLVTGSGPEDRDETVYGHRPFLVLADHLTRHGIAVLRLDDRGVAASSGRYSTATSEDFAGDIQAAVAWLTTRATIDRKRIGIIGHSEGGLIAPIVATRSRDVSFIVLMAGPGIPGDSMLVLQSAAMRRLTGAGEDMVARESAAHRRVHALVRAGADSAAIVPAVRDLIQVQTGGLTDAQREAVGDLERLARTATGQFASPWMRFFITYDPRPTLKQVKCPVLALNGDRDVQVPATENLTAIAGALAAGGNRNVMVKELPGLNHLFQTSVTGSVAEYGVITETIAPAALTAISEWISARTAAKR